MLTRSVTVLNESGIHARPASVLVQEASRFSSSIKILHGEKIADAKSIINVLSLGLKKNETVEVEVDGSDENDALEKLVELFKLGFGDA